MATPYSEFLDLLACFAIYNGNATQKKKLRMEDILWMD